MAGLQDEAEKSNDHLGRVEELLEEIRDSNREEAQAAGRGAGGGVGGLLGGESERRQGGGGAGIDAAALIGVLKFVGDKLANHVDAIAKLEATLSISARLSVAEQVSDIGAAAARAGIPVSAEQLAEITRVRFEQEQRAMVGARIARGVAFEELARQGFSIPQEIAEEAGRAAAASGAVFR